MEPVFSATLERLYRRLPEYIRDGDGDNDWAAKRYLSLVVDQAGDVETLLDRIDCIQPPEGPEHMSELTDPATADDAWLPWIGQMVSVRAGDMSADRARDAIENARSGWQIGSTEAVTAVVQPYLTGTKTVTITRGYLGDRWRVRVTTATAETPRMTLGDLDHYYGSLGAVDAAFATLGAIPDATVGITAAIETQRPAGVQFDYAVV